MIASNVDYGPVGRLTTLDSSNGTIREVRNDIYSNCLIAFASDELLASVTQIQDKKPYQSNSQKLTLWKWPELTEVWSMEFDCAESSLSPDGQMIAYTYYTNGNDPKINLLDLKTKEILPNVFTRDTVDESSFLLSFSPDSKKVAVAYGEGGQIIIWDVESKQPLYEDLEGGLDTQWGLDSKTLATGGSNFRLLLYDLTSSEPAVRLRGYPARASNLYISRDGKRVFSAGRGISYWNLK